MIKPLISTSAVCILIWGIIGISCYYGGYLPNTHKNLVFRTTEANIISHRYEKTLCSYQCNCHNVCSGSGSQRSCSTYCSTCYYKCYDHYLTFVYSLDEYIVSNTTKQTTEIFIYNTNKIEWRDTKYIVGTQVNILCNVCPLKPLQMDDINNCEKYEDHISEKIILKPFATVGLYNTSISSLVFVCIFFVIMIGLIALLFMKQKNYY
jgi:hypothetical protein